MSYFVYILASAKNGTFYIGVTNDVARRVYEHRLGKVGPGIKSRDDTEFLSDALNSISLSSRGLTPGSIGGAMP